MVRYDTSEFNPDLHLYLCYFRNGDWNHLVDFTKLVPEVIDKVCKHVLPALAEQRKVIMGNLLANRKLEKAGKIQNGHESFKQFDNNKTLALCGAGPSLEKHIDEIHERDDLEIIGINRAVIYKYFQAIVVFQIEFNVLFNWAV